MTSSRAVANFWPAGTEAGSVSTTRLWKRTIARCVWATARFSSLRGSGMIALRFAFWVVPAPRGRSNPFLAGMPSIATVLPIFRCSPSAS